MANSDATGMLTWNILVRAIARSIDNRTRSVSSQYEQHQKHTCSFHSGLNIRDEVLEDDGPSAPVIS